MMYILPQETHTEFVESLTDIPHWKSTLHGRYIGFIGNIYGSKKPQIEMRFKRCENNNQSKYWAEFSIATEDP